MKTSSRVLVGVASILILLSFTLPVWSISLTAPQYPEGLGIHIWLTDIVGHEKHDLKKLNQLNHYIGMQAILPEEIPELRIFPLLIMAFSVFGVLAALFKSTKLVYIWCISYVIFAVGGLIDFYLWGYDYGHNLDPQAPIQVPGMSYQPPIIGSKVLLNFIATSYPSWGIIPLILSGMLMSWVLLQGRIGQNHNLLSKSAKHNLRAANIIFITALFCFATMSCKNEATIHWGSDVCSHCRMVLSDKKFGVVLQNEHGKLITLDAIECLPPYQQENPQAKIQHIWLVPFDKPGTLISKSEVQLAYSTTLKSPMGESLAAFSSKAAADSFISKNGGKILQWQDLSNLLNKPKHNAHSHHH